MTGPFAVSSLKSTPITLVRHPANRSSTNCPSLFHERSSFSFRFRGIILPASFRSHGSRDPSFRVSTIDLVVQHISMSTEFVVSLASHFLFICRSKHGEKCKVSLMIRLFFGANSTCYSMFRYGVLDRRVFSRWVLCDSKGLQPEIL